MGMEKVIAVGAEELAASADRAVIHRGEPSVVCLWYERLPPSFGPAQAYLVEERVQWELNPEPAVTRFSFLQRRPGLTREEFARHWYDVHTPLARKHHPCLVRYVQNVVVATLTPDTPDLDGIAELSVERADDFDERMYDSPEGREIVAADVRTFIDLSAGWRVVTTK